MAKHDRQGRGLGVALAVVICLAACGGDRGPAAPAPPVTPSPPPPAPSGSTVTGTAIEFSASGDRRPVPNLRLKVRADRTITARKDGYRQTSRSFVGGYDRRFDLELVRE